MNLPAKLFTFLVLTSSLAAGAAVTVNFEAATDVNLFTANNTATGYDWNATAGVDGSGGIAVSGNGPVWSYNGGSYDVSSADLVITLDAKYSGADTIANRLGLVGSEGDGFSSSNFNLTLNNGGGLSFTNTDTGSSTSVTAPAVGDWTRLVLTVSQNGSDWDLTGELYNLGSTGTSTPSLLGSITDTESGWTSDTSVWAAFKVNTGATALDNFTTAVPEPSTYALLAGFLTLGLVLIRRRRD